MKIGVLPADTFVVLNKTILNESDRKQLIMLYQPIVGSEAISLYFTLWAYLDTDNLMSLEWTHHHLMANMRMKLADISLARSKLEAIGLLRTYQKTNHVNHLVYVLYSPLSTYDFFKNPILNTTLYNNIGDAEYQKIVTCFKIPTFDLKAYEEISTKFTDLFESVPVTSMDSLINDVRSRHQNNIEVQKTDVEALLSLIPDDLLNKNITKETKDLINKLAYIYNLNDDDLNDIIRNAIDDHKNLDKNALRTNAINYYQFEHGGKLPSIVYRNQPDYLRSPTGDSSPRAKMIYQFETTSPYDFLLSKNKGSSLSKVEKDILAMLAIDLKLNPGVINVLLDYVLKINNGRLTKNFIEAIGNDWHRADIKTVKEAMQRAEGEYNKRSKKTKMVSSKPTWFDQAVSKEVATSSEQAEINDILSKYE